MGLLNRLFGKPAVTNVTIDPDRVWLSTAAKFQGIERELQRKSDSHAVAILLVAHFRDVEGELQRMLDGYEGDVPAFVVLAADLNSRIAESIGVDESAVIDLIVAERHPLVSEDERVLAGFAKDLPCCCRVAYHISLQDPLMEIFAGESTRELLQKMGMREDEAIESRMVQRRVVKAQQKLTQAATGNRPADTAKEWCELNVPAQR